MPVTFAGRATLLRRAERRVGEARDELLQIVNGSLLQRYIQAPVKDVMGVESERPMLLLASGYARPLLPLLPESYHQRFDAARAIPLKVPLITTGLALAFTSVAAACMGPIALGIGMYFTVTEAWGFVRLARDKQRMRELDLAAVRVNELLGNIRDWSRRAEDAMDTRGNNLQQIYEERRERTSAGWQAGLRAPQMRR